MARQIAEGLWQLDIPLVGNPLKNLNSYLILGERNLLIDTGFRQDACREAMERQLNEIGVDMDRTDIFLTHLHGDHSGLAPELIRPGCRILISGIDGPLVGATIRDEFWRHSYKAYMDNGFPKEEIDRIWKNNDAQTAVAVKWEGYTPLEDGDILRYGGHELRCILTPGHSPGHMCLYEPEKRWLFSGDHVLFHITPNICRWEAMPDALGSYLLSLEKVRDLPVDMLMPAHRTETGELPVRVEELKAHHAARLEGLMKIVGDNPGMNAYDIAGHMSWSIRCRSWQDFPLTQKVFAVGETLSHLDRLEAGGRVLRRTEQGRNLYYSASAKSAAKNI